MLKSSRNIPFGIFEARGISGRNHIAAQDFFSQAIACARQGREAEALALMQKAIRRRPDWAEAHNEAGLLAASLDRLDEAIRHFRRACALRPDLAEIRNNLGNCLKALGRIADAVSQYETALSLRPGYAHAAANLAGLLIETGRLAQAEAVLRGAIEIDPQPRLCRLLARISPCAADDPLLAVMESMAAGAEALPADDRMELHFALGETYGQLGRIDASLRHFLAGNGIKRQRLDYDETTQLAFLDRIGEIFTPDLMRALRGAGAASDVPVFVVGMPRSGTSLVEQILASHPAIVGAGELDDFALLTARLGRRRGLAFPDLVPGLAAEDFVRLGKEYLSRLTAAGAGAGARRIIDKMPSNFRLLGLIHLALPGARIIHLRRDPLDTCLSCFANLFAGDLPFAYDLGELGRYYRAYERVMDTWRRALPPGAMIEIDYEELVIDLEGQARRMLAHCGMDWHDACLSFHRTERRVRTVSAAQVRRPVFTSSIGRGRAYGALLQPLLDALAEG